MSFIFNIDIDFKYEIRVLCIARSRLAVYF